MKDRLVVNIIVAILFLVVALLIALRLTTYSESSLPWYAAVGLSVLAAALVLFWKGRSR